MSQGARNWPFFTFITLPVSAAAFRRSVCLHKKAGICKTSTTSPTGLHCVSVWTSVSIGQPILDFTLARISKPWLIPTPLWAFADVPFGLSKDDLYMNGIFNLSVIFFMLSAINKE